MRKESKFVSILTSIFYIAVIVFTIYFGFSFYQSKYEFYIPKDNINMLSGSEYTIFLLANNEYNDKSNYEYSSSDNNVVSVDSYGKLTAKNAGQAIITVKSKHGFHTNNIDVKVSGDNIYHISFENEDISTYVDEEYTIIPLINGEYNYDVGLIWSSSDESIIKVDKNGNTVSKKPGTAYITAKIENTDFSSSVMVTVSKKENENNNDISNKDEEYVDTEPVNISPKKENKKPIKNENIAVLNISSSISKKTLFVGEKIKAEYNIVPSNASNKKVDISSNNEEVAKVDSNGYVTAVGVGSCDIIFTTIDGNKTSYFTINVVDKKVDASSIKLDNNKISLYLNDTYNLKFILYPNNSTTEVKWSSSNNNVVKVNSNGKITAVGIGSAKVSVTTSNNKTDTCDVTVTKKTIELNSIKLNKNNTTIIEGGSEILNVIYEPSDATNKKTDWSSSDSNIASVDSNGKVSAKSVGTAIITASSNGKLASCTITVSKKTVAVSSIKLNKNNLSLEINEKHSFTYTINPSNATNQNVTWSSSNSNVVSVDNKGNIKALKAGNAIITVKSKDNNKSDSCNVKVNEPIKVTGIEIEKRNLGMYLNDTYDMKYKLLPNNSSSKGITWETSDANIVSVDNGLLIAKKVGKATITVKTEEGYSDTCNIYVTKDSKTKVKITKLAFDVSSKQVNIGDKIIINVSFTPSNATIRDLDWKSSDTNVAKVDSQGRVTAVGYGNATITATATDGSGKTGKLVLAVVVKGNYIDIRNKTYTNYYEGIETSISSNKNIHMQNFLIDNFGKSNETVYLTTVFKGNIGYVEGEGISSANKSKITRTLIFKLDRNTTNNKKRPTMYVENTGHGQAVDMDSSGNMWINAYGKAYAAGGHWWGGHSGLMNIKYQENNSGDEVSPIIEFKIVDSNNKEYKLPTPAIDEKNDLIAITTGDNIVVPKSTKILIYKYSDFKKGKFTLVYSFNRVSTIDTSVYRQGSALKDGYYYETRSGSTGSTNYLEVFNLLGEQIYKVKLANGYGSKKREAEGIHIYNNNLYFGSTRDSNVFDIGYYK